MDAGLWRTVCRGMAWCSGVSMASSRQKRRTVMSRTKKALVIGGVAMAAGAAGVACGMLCAPASGQEIRRRLAWKSEEQWRSFAKATEELIGRAAAFATAQIEEARKRATVG